MMRQLAAQVRCTQVPSGTSVPTPRRRRQHHLLPLLQQRVGAGKRAGVRRVRSRLL